MGKLSNMNNTEVLISISGNGDEIIGSVTVIETDDSEYSFATMPIPSGCNARLLDGMLIGWLYAHHNDPIPVGTYRIEAVEHDGDPVISSAVVVDANGSIEW